MDNDDITTVTVIDKNGNQTVVDVTKLPPDNPLVADLDQLNSAVGITVHGKVIKKEL